MTIPENLPKVFASIVALADMGPGAMWNMIEGDTFEKAVSKEVDMMTGAGGDIMDVYDPDALDKAKFQIENPDAMMTPWGPGLDSADIDLMMDDSIGLGTLIGLSDTEIRDVMKDADDLLKEDGGNFITDILDHAQDIAMKFNEDPWSLAMNFVDSLLPSGNGADWDPTIDVSGMDGIPVQTMGPSDISGVPEIPSEVWDLGGEIAKGLGFMKGEDPVPIPFTGGQYDIPEIGDMLRNIFGHLKDVGAYGIENMQDMPYDVSAFGDVISYDTEVALRKQEEADALSLENSYAMLDTVLEPDTEEGYHATTPEIIELISEYLKDGSIPTETIYGWTASRSDVLTQKDPALMQSLQTTVQRHTGGTPAIYTDPSGPAAPAATTGDMSVSTLNAMGITGSVAEGTRAAGLDEDPTDTAKLRQVFFEEIEKRPGGKSQELQARIPDMFYESLPLFYLWAGKEIVKGEHDTESLYRNWVGHPNQGYIDNPTQFNSGPNYLQKVNAVRQVLENNNADVTWLSQYPGLNWVVSTFGDKPSYQRQLMKFAYTNGATGPMVDPIHKNLDTQWDYKINKGATDLEVFSTGMLSLGDPALGLQGIPTGQKALINGEPSDVWDMLYSDPTEALTGQAYYDMLKDTEPDILPTVQGEGMGHGDPVPVTSTAGPTSEAGWSAYNKLLQDEYDEYQDYLEEKSSHDALVQSGLDKGIYGQWNPPPVMANLDLSKALGKVSIDPVTGEQRLAKPLGYQAYPFAASAPSYAIPGTEILQPQAAFQKQELESMPEAFDDAENEKRMKGMPYVTKQVDKKGNKIKGTTFVPTIQWGMQHGFRDAKGNPIYNGSPDAEAEQKAKMAQLAEQNIALAKARQAKKAAQLDIQGTNWGAAQGILAGDIGKVMSSGVEDPYLTPYSF